MNRLCMLLIVALLLPVLTGGGRVALAPGDTAPPIWGRLQNGERFTVDYAAHRFTLINFWAPWCTPCTVEMPELQRAYEEKAAAGLQIVGVTHELLTDAEVNEFLEPLGVTYPILRPTNKAKQAWSETRSLLPTSFLVDEQGRILRRYVGATLAQIEGLVGDLDAVLAGKPLGKMVVPEQPAVSTSADRSKANEEE